jgi:hypothetical protein
MPGMQSAFQSSKTCVPHWKLIAKAISRRIAMYISCVSLDVVADQNQCIDTINTSRGTACSRSITQGSSRDPYQAV